MLLIINCDFDENPETNGGQLLLAHLKKIGSADVRIINAVENRITGADLDVCDAAIITGSRASVYDGAEWVENLFYAVRVLDKLNIPTLGICFGFQVVAEALGGKVRRGESFEEGFTAITVTQEGSESVLFKSLPKTFFVYQSHGDVAALPKASVILANNPHSLQAYSLRNFSCVQFHPEILPATAEKMALRDGKNLDAIMNGVGRNYSLPLDILSNFVHYSNTKKMPRNLFRV